MPATGPGCLNGKSEEGLESSSLISTTSRRKLLCVRRFFRETPSSDGLLDAFLHRQGHDTPASGAKGLAPEVSGRAVDEYLAVLDDAAFGAATEVRPKFISPADP